MYVLITIQALKVKQRNNVAGSRNYCCNGKATVHSVRIVKLHVTVKNIQILRAAQQCLYDEFMSPATIKLT
jgi:hypothetical protein